MDPVTAIANGLGELFGWFGAMSSNKSADKQQDIADEYTSQSWFNSLMSGSAGNTATNNQAIMVIAIIFVLLIVALLIISKRKK